MLYVKVLSLLKLMILIQFIGILIQNFILSNKIKRIYNIFWWISNSIYFRFHEYEQYFDLLWSLSFKIKFEKKTTVKMENNKTFHWFNLSCFKWKKYYLIFSREHYWRVVKVIIDILSFFNWWRKRYIGYRVKLIELDVLLVYVDHQCLNRIIPVLIYNTTQHHIIHYNTI